jgi:ribA/ribD-fused uncharacterized protein
VIKKLGRKIKNFDPSVWESQREYIVYKHNYAKFTQHKHLYKILMDYGNDTIFVEASPYDKIWGIRMSAKEAALVSSDEWKGLNLLGKAITKVRDTLLKEKFVA